MHWATTVRRAVLAAAVLAVMPMAHAQINWEGQGGVFMNPLAYPTAAGKLEVATHFIDLSELGIVGSVGVSGGIKGGVELGYTHIMTSVDGVRGQHVIPVKWQFLKETGKSPAVALNVVFRDLTGKGSATDYGFTATKVFPVGKNNLIVSAGGRATKAIGVGLFGINNAYQFRWEGAVAFTIGKRLTVGAEIKEQIHARAWRDVCARYALNDHMVLDAGLANFGTGINNQFAMGFTYKQ